MLKFYFSVKGQLRQFVNDLHSGRLHREFHHGPDPTKPVDVIFLNFLKNEIFIYQ